MSISLMAAAWKLDLPANKKLTLLALCDWANDEGGSLHPSIAAVAARCSVSERSAQRLVHALISDGWLEVIGNEAGGRPGMTRRYQIDARRIYSEASATGANLSPVTGDSLTPVRVTNTARRVTNQAETGDTGVTRTTIDPPIEAPKEKKRACTPVCPAEVSAGVWEDWIALRKAKRAPLSGTALSGIRREANKAGVTLESALRTCCERGWIGFNAAWITSAPHLPVGRESAAGLAARLAREGDERDARRDQEGSRANQRPVIEGTWLELSP